MGRLTPPCPSQIPGNPEIDGIRVAATKGASERRHLPFCNKKAGILSREHPECRRVHQAGWDEMVRLAGFAARSHEFNPNSLQVSLAEIAKRSYGNGSTVARALEEGWRRAVRNAAADGSITHEEEFRLRRFRDRLGLNRSSAHTQATAQLNRTSRQRLTGLTQAAATTVEDGDRLLKRLSKALRKAGFG